MTRPEKKERRGEETKNYNTYDRPNNNKNNGYRISIVVGGETGRAFSLSFPLYALHYYTSPLFPKGATVCSVAGRTVFLARAKLLLSLCGATGTFFSYGYRNRIAL